MAGWGRQQRGGSGGRATNFRYCQECGYEYVAAMRVCTECGQPLVDEPLPAPVIEPGSPRVHGTAEVSLYGLGKQDHSLLEMLLRSEEIIVEWRQDSIVVPVDRASEARELVASIVGRAGPGDDAAQLDEPPRIATAATTLRRSGDVAARWQRVVGWYIDAILIGLVARWLIAIGLSWWLVTLLAAAYLVGGVAMWGATVGKFVVGTRVAVDGGRPSWMASVLRWALVGWVGFAVAVESPVISTIAFVTIVATYAPMLWDPDGRGLHDRLAGTIVIRRPV